MYFDWIYKTNFQFDYCDVIIGYILNIYNTTSDLEVKAKAVICAAELARSHNRWYVMGRVVSMANKDISDDLAFRIVIEIDSNPNNRNNFFKCAEGISLSINNYHTLIVNLLN
jgi:hypothetical protein